MTAVIETVRIARSRRTRTSSPPHAVDPDLELLPLRRVDGERSPCRAGKRRRSASRRPTHSPADRGRYAVSRVWNVDRRELVQVDVGVGGTARSKRAAWRRPPCLGFRPRRCSSPSRRRLRHGPARRGRAPLPALGGMGRGIRRRSVSSPCRPMLILGRGRRRGTVRREPTTAWPRATRAGIRAVTTSAPLSVAGCAQEGAGPDSDGAPRRGFGRFMVVPVTLSGTGVHAGLAQTGSE